jgi:hypothetical protein
MPGEGRFVLSLSKSSGAIEGRVFLNRISFDIDRESYAIVTGTPIARVDKVWILSDANYKGEGTSSNSAFIGSFDLNSAIFNGAHKN